MQSVIEDTVTTRRVGNPLGAYLNAKYRGQEAISTYPTFFRSSSHLDRMDAVAAIIKNFFGCLPSYNTPRFGQGRPFEAVKVEAAGYRIARASRQEKNEKLYGPLDALGNVTYKVTNGHLIIRIYPN